MPHPTPSAPWNPDELRRDIEQFLETGDFQAVLRVLGVTAGRNPLLALQDALKRATSRQERDAFEDIALALSLHVGTPRNLATPLDTLMAELRNLYGEHAARFLPPETVRQLARGLGRVCEPPPTKECLLAILGVELDKAVNETVTVRPRGFGQTAVYFRTHCAECGGEEGGRGKLICPDCLGRARKDMVLGVQTGRLTLRVEGPPNYDQLARLYLEQNLKDYVCGHGHPAPIRPCGCEREVSIPTSPRDGEVLRGRELASGREHFFCVRVEKGD
jgi:hypothetical protein